MIRDDRDDLVYKTEQAKFKAVADDIAQRNKLGQPILVGTVSVDVSELHKAESGVTCMSLLLKTGHKGVEDGWRLLAAPSDDCDAIRRADPQG